MRLGNAAVLLAALAVGGYAYGDTIVTGSVSNRNLAGGLCSSAAASSSSVSLNCGSGGANGTAQVSASVDALDASMQVSLTSYGNVMAPGATTLALTNLSWAIDGTYILAGGTGYGYVDWSATSYRYGAGGGGFFGPCDITLNGVTENCDLNAGFAGGSFLVPYNTPVSLIFGASYSAGAEDFDDVYSGMNLNIDGLQTVDPATMTPEPPTWTLLALAAMAILGLRRIRLVRSEG